MLLEVLDLSFVLLRGLARRKGAQVSSLPRFGILLQGIEAILSRFEFSDHGGLLLVFDGFAFLVRPRLYASLSHRLMLRSRSEACR